MENIRISNTNLIDMSRQLADDLILYADKFRRIYYNINDICECLNPANKIKISKYPFGLMKADEYLNQLELELQLLVDNTYTALSKEIIAFIGEYTTNYAEIDYNYHIMDLFNNCIFIGKKYLNSMNLYKENIQRSVQIYNTNEINNETIQKIKLFYQIIIDADFYIRNILDILGKLKHIKADINTKNIFQNFKENSLYQDTITQKDKLILLYKDLISSN